MLIKNKLKIIVAKAMILIHGANFAHDGVARACRYAAYRIQVAKETVSFGSQPQKRPQAASAQIAPNTMPRPKVGRVTTATRYASWSSFFADGNGFATAPKKPCSLPFGCQRRSRCKTEPIPETIPREPPRETMVTCTGSQ